MTLELAFHMTDTRFVQNGHVRYLDSSLFGDLPFSIRRLSSGISAVLNDFITEHKMFSCLISLVHSNFHYAYDSPTEMMEKILLGCFDYNNVAMDWMFLISFNVKFTI